MPHPVFGSAAHSLSGSVLTAIEPHTPSAPPPFFAALHATHVPAHAVSQQTPSTQLPDWHSVPAPQVAPSVPSFTHCPAPQKYPVRQSVEVTQLVRHAPLLVLHAYPPHDVPFAPTVHVFGAVHALGRLSFPTHTGAPQLVPIAQYAHARCPSHDPVVPHVLDAWSAHSSSGSVPDTMAPHTPSAPPPFFAALHASHAPVHAVSQQYPSTQCPPVHSASAPHACAGPRSGRH